MINSSFELNHLASTIQFLPPHYHGLDFKLEAMFLPVRFILLWSWSHSWMIHSDEVKPQKCAWLKIINPSRGDVAILCRTREIMQKSDATDKSVDCAHKFISKEPASWYKMTSGCWSWRSFAFETSYHSRLFDSFRFHYTDYSMSRIIQSWFGIYWSQWFIVNNVTFDPPVLYFYWNVCSWTSPFQHAHQSLCCLVDSQAVSNQSFVAATIQKMAFT